MIFLIVIFLAALLMEGIGSYISVVGLSALFAGDWVIILMAIILDIAKVTTVSFVYQYWSQVRVVMRWYMTAAVVVLMTITSVGAFGYLSGAFQKAIQPNQEVMLRVDSLRREQASLEAEKKELTESKAKINQQIANVPTSTEDTARRRLIASFKPELERASKRLEVVNKRVDELRGEVLKAESENVVQNVHAGPITYVSKAFDISLESASKWIILTIVLVFDPLAIMLVLAGNFLIKLRNEPTAPTVEAKAPPPMPTSEPNAAVVERQRIAEIFAQDEAPLPYEPEHVSVEEIKAAVAKLDDPPIVEVPQPPQRAEDEPYYLVDVKPADQPEPAQAGLIPETPSMKPSILQQVKVNLPEALFSSTVTPSKRRGFYSK